MQNAINYVHNNEKHGDIVMFFVDIVITISNII